MNQEQEKTDEKCPTCAADMVVKRGRFGPFLACSKYPECKTTKPLLLKTGIPCPLDGGEIVQRQTKKKRTFYGCANYPQCEFTSWQRPMAEACPECNGMIVAERGRTAKCAACGWKGPSSQAVPRDPNVPTPKPVVTPAPEAASA